ncbi:MAG TPA: aminotransferase class I/II-fold pyridoxal phosphate-dependent enzyme, partial [Devosia sp.]|nr:aminotransferase class I/II-fold pyridoxal phosphate-dependent enzyme [Devosia sp.]
REELAPLAALAIERDMVVVCDEIHADLMLDGRRHMPFGAMFPEAADRTVTLYSATKSFNIPGLRCGLMHFGSAALQERFNRRIPPLLLGTPAVVGVYATIAAWEEPEAWLEGLIRLIEGNRDHMLARFAAELPEVAIGAPEATYLAWADFKALRLPERPYLYLLDKAKVAGGDGAHFGPGYEEFVRFNVATSRSILDDKIDRIVRAVRRNAA